MAEKFCPGAANISGTPTLKVKSCPDCGAEIELFSSDLQRACQCGFMAYNNIQSCILWCKSARECVGDEMYEKLIGDMQNRASNTSNPPERLEPPGNQPPSEKNVS